MIFNSWAHSGALAVALGLVCLLAAGWFLLWTMAAAGLAFVPCDGLYSLTAEIPRCRLPAFTSLGFMATGVLGIVLIAVGLFLIKNQGRNNDYCPTYSSFRRTAENVQ